MFAAAEFAKKYATLLDPPGGLDKGLPSSVETHAVVLTRMKYFLQPPRERLETQVAPDLSAPDLAQALDEVEVYGQPSAQESDAFVAPIQPSNPRVEVRGVAVAGWLRRLPTLSEKDETPARIIDRSLRAEL